jgi:hypothetical protein
MENNEATTGASRQANDILHVMDMTEMSFGPFHKR